MNAFRLAGDMTHLLSIILLLLKIRATKSCAGISLKTQELYVIVFMSRYLDLFRTYYSLYNSLMKIIFLGTSMCIVWYMRSHKVVRQTYNKDDDTFRHFFLVLPCLGLALLVHHNFTFIESFLRGFTASVIMKSFLLFYGNTIIYKWILWTFSLYLESVAILPQLVLLQKSSNIDNLTGTYVFLLGAYRGLYLFNWVYRFFTENHRVRWIPWLSGLIQTAIYTDFFYYYIKSWKNREQLKLPA